MFSKTAALGLAVCFIGMTQKIQAQTLKLDLGLYATDFTLRTLDIVSTYQVMHSACKCVVEGDPVAPSGKSWVTETAFQYGMSAAFIAASYELRKHHHSRLARILMLSDIAGEGLSVADNVHNSHVAAGRPPS